MASKSGKTQFAIKIAIQARDLASRVVRGAADGIKRSFDRIKSGIRSTVDFVSKLGTAFSTVGAGIISVARRIGEALVDTSDRLSGIAKVSQKTRVSAQVLQELGYAAEQSGVDTESLHRGIETLNRKLGQMKAGSKELSGFLLRVGGPAFLKQVQGAKSTEEALELMLTAMGKIEGEEKRAAFAMAAFGKSGEDIALLLADGTEALRAQRAEAHAYAVQTDENVQTAAEFGDELDKLKGAGRFVIDTAAIEAMRQLLPDMREMSMHFRENRESIVAMAKEIGGGIADAIKGIKAAFVWIYDNREAILDWAKALAIIFGAAGLLGSIRGIVAGIKTIAGLGVPGGKGAPPGGGGGGGGGLAIPLLGLAWAAADDAAQKWVQGPIADSTSRLNRRRLAPLGIQHDPGIGAFVDTYRNPLTQGVFDGLAKLAEAVDAWKAPGMLPEVTTPVTGAFAGKGELTITLRGPQADTADVNWVSNLPNTVAKVKQIGQRTLGVEP